MLLTVSSGDQQDGGGHNNGTNNTISQAAQDRLSLIIFMG